MYLILILTRLTYNQVRYGNPSEKNSESNEDRNFEMVVDVDLLEKVMARG